MCGFSESIIRVNKISDHSHSCPDVTDDDGETPLDRATRGATNTLVDQEERKRCSEVVDYLKSLLTEYSELLLHHTLYPHITKIEWLHVISNNSTKVTSVQQ